MLKYGPGEGYVCLTDMGFMVKLCTASTHKLEGEIVENPSRLQKWIGPERACRLIPRTSLFCCSLYCLVWVVSSFSWWCLWLCVVLEVLVKTISGHSIWINLPNPTKRAVHWIVQNRDIYLASTVPLKKTVGHSTGCHNGFWRFYCTVFLLHFFVLPVVVRCSLLEAVDGNLSVSNGYMDAHANKIKMVGGRCLNGQSIFIRRPFALILTINFRNSVCTGHILWFLLDNSFEEDYESSAACVVH